MQSRRTAGYCGSLLSLRFFLISLSWGCNSVPYNMFLQEEVAELRAALKKAEAEKEDWGLCTRWLICLASFGYIIIYNMLNIFKHG